MRPRSPSTLRGLVLLAGLVTGLVTGCGADDSKATDTSPAGPSGKACSYPDDGRDAAKEVDPPPDHATLTGEVGLTITTNVGVIEGSLDADAAPCTVSSFASLAEQAYFDDTQCHRLTLPPATILVLQCGDPTGSSVGGPGYSFADELSGKETYGAGTLAMANGGPDTNGSQFFMVYDDSLLPPSYTVFGHLDETGLKLVQGIGAKGTVDGGPDGAPAEPVTITSVTVGD